MASPGDISGPGPLVRMEGIDKSFFGVKVLSNVGFTLFPAEVHVLLGENGAGKSTLIKILSGAYTCDAGRIALNGRLIDPGRHSPRDAELLGIATVYQSFHLIPHLSVAENIALTRLDGPLGLVSWRRMRRIAGQVLARLELALDPGSPVRTLSISERQMLEIAIAVSKNARVLILDEPTSALSKPEVEALFAFLGRMKRQGIGIIYISHRLEEIREIGDRLTILRDGRVVHTGPVAGLSTAAIVELMTGHRIEQDGRSAAARAGRPYFAVKDLRLEGSAEPFNLAVHAGEILGITGLIGSGKSELARAVFGGVPPRGGEVFLGDASFRPRSARQSIRRGIGYLPEDRDAQGLCLNMSVKDNISLTYHGRFTPFSFSVRREKRMARRFVDQLRIRCFGLDQQVQYLSGGNKQKVAFAKWLCADCRLLLLDEPTIGIDVKARQDLYQLVRDFVREGRAAIFITSDIDEALLVPDRLLVMARGRIVAEVDPRRASKQEVARLCLSSGTAPAGAAAPGTEREKA